MGLSQEGEKGKMLVLHDQQFWLPRKINTHPPLTQPTEGQSLKRFTNQNLLSNIFQTICWNWLWKQSGQSCLKVCISACLITKRHVSSNGTAFTPLCKAAAFCFSFSKLPYIEWLLPLIASTPQLALQYVHGQLQGSILHVYMLWHNVRRTVLRTMTLTDR